MQYSKSKVYSSERKRIKKSLIIVLSKKKNLFSFIYFEKRRWYNHHLSYLKFKNISKLRKKEVITINVRHAMQLDKERVENIVSSISDSLLMTKLMRGFFASAEGSRTYDQLGKTKEYICYALRPLNTIL